MAYNLKSEEEVKEYIKNLGTEYRFGCYSEKNPEGRAFKLYNSHVVTDYLNHCSLSFTGRLPGSC